MGHAHSKDSASGAEEWKGPFSDPEYDSIAAKYKSVSQATGTADAHGKLQEILALEVSDKASPEVAAPLHTLGKSFYNYCVYMRDLEAGNVSASRSTAPLKIADFVKGVAACMRASSQTIARSMFHLFGGGNAIDESQLTQLFFACLCMADEFTAASDSDSFAHVARKLARAALGAGSQLSSDEFVRWMGAQFPLLYSIFTTWIACKVTGTLARPSYNPPQISHKSDILSPAHFVVLSAVATELQSTVDRLYTSVKDGLSFNRLCYHVLGYNGPTMVVIRDTAGSVFGFYCDTEWKESSRYYGGNGCFLFRLEPEINVYRVTSNSSNENYMYLNTKGVALPRGLGMGGNTSSFRLFLSEDFDENCYTTPKCLSFESGKLSKEKQFFIETMEVWGCGGAESQRNQSAHRQETADLINRARKVDKAQFLGNDFDKEFFLSKTFGHGTDRGRIADDES